MRRVYVSALATASVFLIHPVLSHAQVPVLSADTYRTRVRHGARRYRYR
jgi:hypothetical protein